MKIVLIGILICSLTAINCDESRSSSRQRERNRQYNNADNFDRYRDRYGERYGYSDYDEYYSRYDRRPGYDRRGGFENEKRDWDFGQGNNQISFEKTGFKLEIPKEGRREQYRDTRGINDFAWELFKSSNKDSNYVLSPLSPQILLNYLAWVADGKTKSELIQGSKYSSPETINRLVSQLLSSQKGRELDIATAFFVSREMKLNEEFLAKSLHALDVINVDFKNSSDASELITKWANKKTKGGLKLKNLSFPQSTKVALTSALYFKSKWVYTFQPSTPENFKLSSGENVVADMLKMKRKFRHGYINDYAQWASMPYESENSFVIILPNKDQTVDDVINKMSSRDFDSVMHSIDRDSSNAEVNITFPKFKFETTSNLLEPLQKMGVKTLFTPNAKLPYLSNYEDVQITTAQQQTSIDVDENGTVLITFTNLNVVALSLPIIIPKVVFTVDRPFIAIVANRQHNVPYMIAKVVNPKQ